MMGFFTNRYKGLKQGRLEFKFIQSEMRNHLVQCFQQIYMEPFPKQKLVTPIEIEVINIDIDLF